MKELKNEKKQIVVLPNEGFCTSNCCADCALMDLSNKNDFGNYYCREKGRYFPANDRTCNAFSRR